MAGCAEEEVRLSLWLRRERNIHKNPEHEQYNAERAARMKEYSYLKPARSSVWETRLQKVVEFEKKNGGWPSRAAGCAKEKVRLGQWLVDQRAYHGNLDNKRHRAEQEAMLRTCGYLNLN